MIKNVEELNNILKDKTIIDQLEDKLKKYTGFKNCSVVNSGTSALHAALFAAGVKQGHEVIIPSIADNSTANIVIAMGAIPIFCDVGEDLLIISF